MAKFCTQCGGNIEEGKCTCEKKEVIVNEEKTVTEKPTKESKKTKETKQVKIKEEKDSEKEEPIEEAKEIEEEPAAKKEPIVTVDTFIAIAKSTLQKGIDLFKTTEKTLEENKDNKDIKSLLTNLVASTIVIFVAFLLSYKKVIALMLGGTNSIFGSSNVSDYIKIDFASGVKILFIILVINAIFMGIFALGTFLVGKLIKKDVDFTNILVSSSILSFITMGTFLLMAVTFLINYYVGLLVLLFGLFYFVIVTLEYFKVTYEVKFEDLMYYAPATVALTIAVGSFLSNKIIPVIFK